MNKSKDLLKSFSDLLVQFGKIADNALIGLSIFRPYKLTLNSDSIEKKDALYNSLNSILSVIHMNHRQEIMNKDFEFILKEQTQLMDIPLAKLYENTIDSDKPDVLKDTNNLLLYIFYQVAPEEDQKIIDTKYRKKSAAPVPEPKRNKNKGPKTSGTKNITDQMQDLVERNAPLLKEAETNPSNIGPVVASLFKNNANEMSDILTGVLGNILPSEKRK